MNTGKEPSPAGSLSRKVLDPPVPRPFAKSTWQWDPTSVRLVHLFSLIIDLRMDVIYVTDPGVSQAATSDRTTTVTPDDDEDFEDIDQPLDLSCKTPTDVQSTSSLVASHQHDRRTLELDFFSSNFLARLTESIVQPVRSCPSVCLCVNQGGANYNRLT